MPLMSSLSCAGPWFPFVLRAEKSGVIAFSARPFTSVHPASTHSLQGPLHQHPVSCFLPTHILASPRLTFPVLPKPSDHDSPLLTTEDRYVDALSATGCLLLLLVIKKHSKRLLPFGGEMNLRGLRDHVPPPASVCWYWFPCCDAMMLSWAPLRP